MPDEPLVSQIDQLYESTGGGLREAHRCGSRALFADYQEAPRSSSPLFKFDLVHRSTFGSSKVGDTATLAHCLHCQGDGSRPQRLRSIEYVTRALALTDGSR